MKTSAVLTASLLVLLSVAGTASADEITVLYSDLLLFSNSDITTAGATLFQGNIGTNANYDAGAGDTHFLGSIYAGGNVDLGAAKVVGSNGTQSHIDLETQVLNATISDGIIPVDGSGYPTFPQQWERVIANGNAILTTGATGDSRIYDRLDALTASIPSGATISQTTGLQDGLTIGSGADTLAMIVMPSVTFTGFTATAGDQSCSPAPCTLTLNPGELYGDVVVNQDRTLELRNDAVLGGDYYFKSLSNNGTLTLKVDLTNGPVNIYVDGDISIGSRGVLWVTNAAIATHPDATDGYLPISHPAAQALAAQIYWETTGRFDMNGADTTLFTSIFGGTLYSTWDGTGNGITLGQHIDWFGALWAYDTIDLADHSRYTYVAQGASVPEPSTLLLFSSGLIGIAAFARKRLF